MGIQVKDEIRKKRKGFLIYDERFEKKVHDVN